MVNIEIIPAYDYPREVGALFSEYTGMLIAGDSSFREYLAMKYGLPWGRLYLARCGEEWAGCIGMRKMDGQNCEMKRLYVRPRFRGRRIGEALVRRIIADARGIGYAHMLLDTLPFLGSAVHLYQKYGFYEIESYNDSPVGSSIYMRLDL